MVVSGWKKTSKMVSAPVSLSPCLPEVDDSKIAKVATDNMPPTPPPSCRRTTLSGWWKQHGHLFLTMSRHARRYLAIPATSFLVELFFSVTGQVDAARTAFLSPDTLTLVVFMHETLPLVRNIRTDRIVEART